mmetsp:Transcript_13927/g.31589  ORF Transcript_13927/g.31589 Transcript_13927/m.31589 type:complete len:364 (-) Transcript_13927:83-1174(-)
MSEEAQQSRQALHSAVFKGAQATTGKDEFFKRLHEERLDENVLHQLYSLGFKKSSLPPGQLHTIFPKASQVNKYESTVAYAYTDGDTFAYRMNNLSRDERWDELFSSYGKCVKGLYSYSEKMQEAYGKEQTLFRGLVGDWSEFRDRYAPGKQFAWPSFTSTTVYRKIAEAFAAGWSSRGSGRPIMFEIHTRSRGAPLMEWSEFRNEGEVLLQPFQGFSVERLDERGGMLIIELQTVKFILQVQPSLEIRPDVVIKERPTIVLPKVQHAQVRNIRQLRPDVVQNLSFSENLRNISGGSLRYRLSMDIHNVDSMTPALHPGEYVSACDINDDWVACKTEYGDLRYLPRSIEGEQVLGGRRCCVIA